MPLTEIGECNSDTFILKKVECKFMDTCPAKRADLRATVHMCHTHLR